MSIKGGGKLLKIVVFLELLATVAVVIPHEAFAGFGETGDDLHPSAGIECKIKIKGSDYSVGGWTVDTCFGMSWVYYKWPTDEQGNPIYADIHFPCTGGTCATGRTESIVTKECSKPQNGGGFWYLGFEAYSTEGLYYLNSLGYQVGKPKVKYLTEWLRAEGVGNATGRYITGLYPVTIFGTKYINSAFQGIYSPLNSSYLTLSSEELNANYTPSGKLKGPGKCSDYKKTEYQCTHNSGSGGWFIRHFPYIIVNGERKSVSGEYYGTTKDVKADWDEEVARGIITSAEDGSPISGEDFVEINYFCSGRTSNISGRSGVKVDSGATQFSKWTDEENPATVETSSVIAVADKVNVTFYHQMRGKGQTRATIEVNQTSLKGKDINNKENWKDAIWDYSGQDDEFDEDNTYTRTRTVTREELEAISAGTTTVCDTLSFGVQQSEACVKLKPTSPIKDVLSKSRVTAPKGSSNTVVSEANTTTVNGTTKTVYYDVTVASGTQSVDLQFDHSLSAKSQSGSGAAEVSYAITQSVNNSTATVTNYTKKTGSKTLTATASNSEPIATADSPVITVSNITATTNITICQTMVATYGVDMTTKVCANVKGNQYAVTGRSSVGTDEDHMDATTNWVNGSKTASTSRTIYAPYNENATTKAYFRHELKADNSAGVSSSTGNITYSIKRGNSYLAQNQTYSFNTSSGEHEVYGQLIDVSLGTTCQTLEFSYYDYNGAPKACIEVKPSYPTFKGSSTVSGNDDSETVTTNEGEKTLAEIKVRVAAGETATQRIDFSHDITASSSRADANGKSTGTMPYVIVKDYTDDDSGNFSGTFPSSGAASVKKTISDYTSVKVKAGESKTVCETLTFENWSSKVCALVTGELSLPSVESQTSATYKSSTRTSNWATKNAPVQSAETITATIPIMPSVDANGGVEVPITFTHDVKALHTELSVQNTGDVSYTLTTTNTTNNYDDPGTFKITVGSAPPTQFINPKITSDKTVKVKINDDFTACQTLSFDYDGITRKTTACVRFRGISADPKGISSIKINGCGGGQQVNTNYVDGAVVWLDIDSCTKDEIRGSDIVFDHGFSIGGEMSVVIPFETENSCINGAGCSQNYSWPYDEENNKPNFKYTGRSDGSRAIAWVYRKKDSNGNLTNIYERNPPISDDDAKAMFEMGAVCETMAYKYDGIWHHSTACVRFNVKNSPCPSLGVSAGTTMSTSYVKKYLGNEMTSPTPDQTTVIYAKPTDNIEFTHCYYPGAQTTRYTDDDEGKYANPSNNGQTVLIPTPNAYVEQQNRFTIGNKAGTDSYVDNRNVYTFTNYGQIMKYEEDSNAFVGVVGNPNSSAVVSSKTPITTNAVGHTIEQSLLDHPGTNSVSGRTQGICGSGCAVNYKNSFDNKWYDVIKRNSDSPISESSSAKVIVPYNYITRASIDTGNGIVYAGETMPGKKVNITVNKRQNNTVGDEYATKTVESTVRLFMFYTTNGNQNEGSDREVGGSNVNPCGYYGGLGYTSCVELQPESGKSNSGFIFNKNSSTNGSNETVDVFENSYNVPDLRAGSKVCMGVSVYPAASTDTEPSNGNTFISRAYCRIVAKKPSFQVWGGSLYSAGNISANGATKYTIDGVYAYNPIHQSHAPSITYGSWVEQSIMSNGTVVGVYSGAATGYGATNLQVTNANPGGSSTSDLCNLSRLTFANVNCAINSVGNFGAAGTSTATKTSIKQEYATKASNKDADRNSDINNYRGINVSTAYTEEGNTRYTYASGSLALSASQRLATGVTHVIYAKGNIVIRKNSLLYNDGGYHTIDEIPQYIIIADGNIYIEPDVTRVDAILISGKTLNTCAKLTGGSITEAKKGSSNLVSNLYCAQQLKVNGVVIADTLKFYRIYGASTGLNSIAPAEIIDYTPNIYFWGSNSSTSHGSIYTSYQRELAPRQ